MTVEQNIQELNESLGIKLYYADTARYDMDWPECLARLQSAAQIVHQIMILTEARHKTLPTPHEMRGVFKKKGKSK